MANSGVDPTYAKLAELEQATQDRAIDLVTLARNAGLPLIITSAKRTRAQQLALVRAGRSRTLTSAHLSGRAFDVDLYGVNRDRVPKQVWDWLGPRGEQFGLTWGGRWKSFVDVGHFES